MNAVNAVLNRDDPGRFVYAPNYWQWFTHHRNHGTLPEELNSCPDQLGCIRRLGLDVFSRNIYSDPEEYWFGGLSDKEFDNVEVERFREESGRDRITTVRYTTPSGSLEERFRYIHSESTLVQETFLVDDPDSQLNVLEDLLSRVSRRFLPDRYRAEQERTGADGIVVAGDFHSPLKMLHLLLGPVETTFLLTDDEERARRLMAFHEEDQLNLLRQMLEAGVPAVMSMDNLDTMFHPPRYVEEYSASFYEKASSLCHEYGSNFFIHACGQQKANLKLISSLGVDGLEGVAYPPLGDVELEEALEMTGDRFIISGGISAMETGGLKDRDSVFEYVEDLLTRLKPYRNRFILSASCNTSIDASWETLVHFRDAWLEYGCS